MLNKVLLLIIFIKSFLSVIFVLSVLAMWKAYLVFSPVIDLIGSAVFRMRLLGQDISGSRRTQASMLRITLPHLHCVLSKYQHSLVPWQ